MREHHVDVSGRNNPNYGKHLTEEAKRKIGDANSGKNSYWYGRRHTPETKEKIRLTHLGRKRPDMLGKNNPYYKIHSVQTNT